MDDLKNSSYYSIFVDVYKFFCRFINGSPAGSYTVNWIREAEEGSRFIIAQYGEEPFVAEMCAACISEMKRKLEYVRRCEKEGKALPAGISVCVRESRYWKNFQDFWRFFEKNYGTVQLLDVSVKNADLPFWEQCCKEACMLGYQNGGTAKDRFMQELLLAAMNELEAVENSRKKTIMILSVS